jgi:hypothetical protein
VIYHTWKHELSYDGTSFCEQARQSSRLCPKEDGTLNNNTQRKYQWECFGWMYRGNAKLSVHRSASLSILRQIHADFALDPPLALFEAQ